MVVIVIVDSAPICAALAHQLVDTVQVVPALGIITRNQPVQVSVD